MSGGRPESEFPTIIDARDCLNDLIDKGFGDHPVQILVVPDSTLQAIAGGACSEGKPVLMIELTQAATGRIPVCLISDRAIGNGMPTTVKQ